MQQKNYFFPVENITVRSVTPPDIRARRENCEHNTKERKKKKKRDQANMKNVKISNECWNENNNNNDINDTR